MYLEGPSTLRLLRSGERSIVLLGEQHFKIEKATLEDLCPRDGVTPVLMIADYLDVLFSTLRKTKIDLFLEMKSPKNWDVDIDEFQDISRRALVAIRQRYINCFFKQPTCRFPNVQFHHTDFRRTDTWNSITKTISPGLSAGADLRNVVYALLIEGVTPYALREKILSFPPIVKELETTNPDVAAVILRDLDAITTQTQAAYNNLKANMNDTSAIKEYFEGIELMWISIVDYYLLAGIFQQKTSNNVIVYVGDHHRRHLEQLLLNLNFVMPVAIDKGIRYCIAIDKGPGFFFAPFEANLPPTPGYMELVSFLSKPTFSFETSWYASEFSIIYLMAIYFYRRSTVSMAYPRMKRLSDIYFSFQRVKDTLALFVHHSGDPRPEPALANALLLPTRQQIALKDTSVRALFIYKDAYARLSPLAQIILTLLIAHTAPPPTSDLLVLLEIKNS